MPGFFVDERRLDHLTARDRERETPGADMGFGVRVMVEPDNLGVCLV